MNHPTPTQRLWLQVHARHAEQPWLMPAAMVAFLAFVVLLAAYVHILNSQVLRGEKFRAAQRSMPAYAVDPFYPAYAAQSAQPRLMRADLAQVVPQHMTVATSTPVAYALPAQ